MAGGCVCRDHSRERCPSDARRRMGQMGGVMGDPIALVLFGGMLATMLGAIVGILIMLDDGD
jgi:hypothetical protein